MASGVKTTSKDLGEARIRGLIEDMKRSQRGPHVKAGVLAAAGEHENPEGGEPTPVVAIAVWNEFGTSTIPERAALRTATKALMGPMADLGGKLLAKIIEGGITIDRALDVLGLKVQAAYRRSIADWTTPPNAPSTIRAKARRAGRLKIAAAKRKGGGEAEAAALATFNNPLEDTGQYRNSITYEKVK